MLGPLCWGDSSTSLCKRNASPPPLTGSCITKHQEVLEDNRETYSGLQQSDVATGKMVQLVTKLQYVVSNKTYRLKEDD